MKILINREQKIRNSYLYTVNQNKAQKSRTGKEKLALIFILTFCTIFYMKNVHVPVSNILIFPVKLYHMHILLKAFVTALKTSSKSSGRKSNISGSIRKALILFSKQNSMFYFMYFIVSSSYYILKMPALLKLSLSLWSLPLS